ncbi:MAG: glutaredoxin family protein [Bacteroidota bacterium]
MILVELYSKQDCYLCDQARSLLEQVRKEIPFDLSEIKIAPGDRWYDQFKESIPVIYVGKKLAFRYRVDEEKLRNLLTEKTKERTDSR